jgi:parallel beta-helix repeat protein
LSGNGYAALGNDFGIGLTSLGNNDNVIVDNVVVGNANGILLVAGAEGNFIRRNIVAGNPAIQVSVDNPTTTGVDIRNLAAPGTNTFEDNFCLTAVNAACPAVDDTPPIR